VARRDATLLASASRISDLGGRKGVGKIVVETQIGAPIERCFDLAREVEIHCLTAAHTNERAVAGKTSGLLELGDEITFEGRHFGLRLRLTARIIACERPVRFIDEMVTGVFDSLQHVHEFTAEGSGTLMRDTIEWMAPFGALGGLADRLFLVRHMRDFLERRNLELKRYAESHLAQEARA
jgi:ligand-binding SRPBCC domain-containing protein